LRRMRDDAEENGPQWATENDERVTKVGKIIRKFRIDELPQFYNVLMGDMSVVGPRPERLTFVAEFEEKIPGFIQRLQVKPGLTGLAQINGGYHLTAEEKLAFDVEYIKGLSYKQELIILLKTVLVVLKGDGAY
jgi:lipopolysaccharide/colanic/teichoic acid biosynthesis glycosyltransferase